VVADDSTAKFQKKVDEDWKQRAREERLKQSPPHEEAHPKTLPRPTFPAFLNGLVTDALINLGAVKNPMTGQQELNLDAARYLIDVLQMLRQKTKGNLDETESQFLDSALHELHLRFVEAASGAGPGQSEGEE